MILILINVSIDDLFKHLFSYLLPIHINTGALNYLHSRIHLKSQFYQWKIAIIDN